MTQVKLSLQERYWSIRALASLGQPPVENLFNVLVGELFASMFHVTT